MLTGRFIGDYSRGDEFIYKDVGRLLNDSKVATIEIFDTCYEVSDIYTDVGDRYWSKVDFISLKDSPWLTLERPFTLL